MLEKFLNLWENNCIFTVVPITECTSTVKEKAGHALSADSSVTDSASINNSEVDPNDHFDSVLDNSSPIVDNPNVTVADTVDNPNVTVADTVNNPIVNDTVDNPIITDTVDNPIITIANTVDNPIVTDTVDNPNVTVAIVTKLGGKNRIKNMVH